ncbi:RNA polymerase sigma factor RpoE [Labilithrix luteola]|uniref:RNA polymerase sigma factor RpoE n=1 Tax=Labilithrix luteola TaxID=1391654 RepID=A0A0K1Q8H4_9BACT|nr:RNA polymerase sigma factor RpoE [Labilithrix luteola]
MLAFDSDRSTCDDASARAASTLDFATVYDEFAPFVWRAALRLGVAETMVEDVVQEIFLVIHRRLPEFEGRSSLKTWIFGIALRVVRLHRRTVMRRRLDARSRAEDVDPAALPDRTDCGPDAALARRQAMALLSAVLDELDDELREVFVLADIEGLTVPEIAEALATNANTVYSRLRTARKAFEQGLARARARDQWRVR